MSNLLRTNIRTPNLVVRQKQGKEEIRRVSKAGWDVVSTVREDFKGEVATTVNKCGWYDRSTGLNPVYIHSDWNKQKLHTEFLAYDFVPYDINIWSLIFQHRHCISRGSLNTRRFCSSHQNLKNVYSIFILTQVKQQLLREYGLPLSQLEGARHLRSVRCTHTFHQ